MENLTLVIPAKNEKESLPSVLNERMTIQKIGKNISNPTDHATMVLSDLRRELTERAMGLIPHVLKFLPTMRIKKIATILAKMIAYTPPADPKPTF